MDIITLGIARLDGTHLLATDWVTVGGITAVVPDIGVMAITPAEDGGTTVATVVIILARVANISY